MSAQWRFWSTLKSLYDVSRSPNDVHNILTQHDEYVKRQYQIENASPDIVGYPCIECPHFVKIVLCFLTKVCSEILQGWF